VDNKPTEIDSIKGELVILNDLGNRLSNITSLEDVKFSEVASIATRLGVGHAPLITTAKVNKKAKKVTITRKPYHTYLSADDIEIWVGRGANDNDELSCDLKYRDADEWWLHVAGQAGSHVVIKSTDDNLPVKYRQTLLDAAVLAAVHSKAVNCSKAAVSLTRCRNVSKPRGAAAGLVHLQGEVISVSLNLSKEKTRMDRLKKVPVGDS